MIEFNLLFTLIIIVGVFAVMLGTVAYIVLAERKVSAYVQDRVGPDRVGPYGLLQPMADGIKMFLKEDIIPKHVDKLFFFMAPGVAIGTALFAFAIVPFGPSAATPGPVPVTVDQPLEVAQKTFDQQITAYQKEYTFAIAPGLDIGILLSFAIGSLAVYGVILGGWSANNKYSLLGSLRSSAQIISYEIPLGMSILGVVLFAGSMNLEKIISWQANNGWFILYQPLAFLLFMVSVYAECNRLPFDLPEAEQELVGGYHTEYSSSMKLGLFLMGEYVHMITTCFLMSILFFGGWHFPGLSDIEGVAGLIIKFAVLAVKVGFFIALYLLVRWTIPRFKFDQLMSIAWQILIPLAILNLVAVMVVREFGISKWVLAGISLLMFFGATLLSTRETTASKRKVIQPALN